MKTIDRKPGFALALALGAAGLGCTKASADKPQARPVRVEAVRTAVEGGRLRYSATIQPHEQVRLAFKASGYVHDIGRREGLDGSRRSLQQGDEIRRGAVLARVDEADARERVNQARAQAAEAAANLERARLDGERAERLYAVQSVTRPDYDAARAARAMAVARAEAAQAQLQAAELALRDCTLSSPIDGVVLSRDVEVGTLASPGLVAFAVADLTRVKAVFGVPDHLVGRLRVGTSLVVTTDSSGDTPFTGTVTAVSPSADPQSRVFSVEVTIANPERHLKAGMIASVEVPEKEGERTVAEATVPLAAIVKGTAGGGYAVFVAEGTDTVVARSREVRLGPIAGNRVAVSEGLKAGERIIVTGASLLRNGEPVRIIPGEES
jgi:multidrug efflux system membrane fusion protein